MKIEWPVFWILKPEDQVKLMEWQFNTYGYHLQIPPMPDSESDTEIESEGEIGHLIRQPPSRSRGRGA